jgi:hypothetical protein
MKKEKVTFWQPELIKISIKGSFRRLDPRLLWHNPVMFVVEIVSVVTTLISLGNLIYGGPFWLNIHMLRVAARPRQRRYGKHRARRTRNGLSLTARPKPFLPYPCAKRI